MDASASVSTSDQGGDADRSEQEEPEPEPEVHNNGEHKADLEPDYEVGFFDVVSDGLERFKLYLFLLAVLGVGAAWYFGVPRYALVGGVTYLLSVAVASSPVESYISKFDDGADNYILEVSPVDDAEHHCFEAGDGAIRELESKDGNPAYPVRGVPSVYEVETLEPETGTFQGSLRAALPYSKYIEVEYMRQYYREHIVPLADRASKLEARKEASKLQGSISRAVDMVETLERGLNSDLEPDDDERDVHELDKTADHARRELNGDDDD